MDDDDEGEQGSFASEMLYLQRECVPSDFVVLAFSSFVIILKKQRECSGKKESARKKKEKRFTRCYEMRRSLGPIS
jgi:hypothetical protein